MRSLSAIIAISLLAAFVFLAVPVANPPSAFACGEVHPKTGDLNADGAANSLDALAVLVYQAGMMPKAPDATWMGGADVNCDSSVNAIDASIILQADAGLTTIRP